MNAKEMFGLNLPEQVSYFGFDEPYFFGNGVSGAGGLSNGIWNYCTGYGYGDVVNFIKRERLKVYIDGRPFTLQGQMHRAKNTGIFYSLQEFQKAAVCLADFAIRDEPYTARLIAVRNTSDSDIIVRPYAEIRYLSDINTVATELTDAFHMMQHNRPDRLRSWLTVSFGGCETIVRHFTDFFRSEAAVNGNDITLAPGELKYFTLFHDARVTDLPIGEQSFPNRADCGGAELLEECISEWLEWSKKGIDTLFIPDGQCREVISGCSIILRMLQGRDGGVMATPRVYIHSYVRDSFCAMKGMLAAERYPEVKKFLEYQFEVYKFRTAKGEFGVPCSTEIGGGDGVFWGFGDEENWSCESPGLCVILARDYYKATGDIGFIKSMDEFLRYCVDVQLAHAKKLDWLMYFNTDETESQGNGTILAELAVFPFNWRSMTSSVMCMASVEFFIEYLELIDQSDTIGDYAQTLNKVRAALDENYWEEKMGVYHWFRTPEGAWPKTLIPDYHIMPLYFHVSLDKARVESSARNMLKYWDRKTGFIPNQVFGENEDFCGHNMGYLLFMAAALELPEADDIYEALIRGGSLSAYGMWCETYYDDGTPYQAPTTFDNIMHNFRCFESGLNLDAIIGYWKEKTNL